MGIKVPGDPALGGVARGTGCKARPGSPGRDASPVVTGGVLLIASIAGVGRIGVCSVVAAGSLGAVAVVSAEDGGLAAKDWAFANGVSAKMAGVGAASAPPTAGSMPKDGAALSRRLCSWTEGWRGRARTSVP